MDQGSLANNGVSAPKYNRPNGAAEGRRFSKWWLWIGLLVALLLIGFGVYWFAGRTHPVKKPTPASDTTQGQSAVGSSTDTTPTSYVSKGNDLNLNFTYPGNWQATPPSGGNMNDQTITLTSPHAAMADAADESVEARAVMTIRPKGSDLTELSSGSATLAITSFQIAYDNPTSVQHGYPYLSFIRLAGGDNPNHLFEEVMITGAMKFTQNQALSPYSLLQLDPIISVTFYQCLTTACTGAGAKPLGISQDVWQSSELGQQALAIFKSIQLR